MARGDYDDDDQQVGRRSGRQGFASMSRDRVRQIAAKGGRSSGGSGSSSGRQTGKRQQRSYDDEDDYDDYDEDEYDEDDEGDYHGKNPNRVRGGKQAANTRRQRGTGFFENNSHEQQAELGRRGGSRSGGGGSRGADDEYSGRHPSGYSDREIKQHRIEGGRKAAETRRRRGTGFFENNSYEKQAELGRRGGSRSFGDQSDQDEDEEDGYEEEDYAPRRRR